MENLFAVAIVSAIVSSNIYPQDLFRHSALQPVDITEVDVDDDFWNRRLEIIQETTLPLLLDIAEKQGKIDNFRIVSGRKAGKIRLYNAPDSDVYKLLEAAGYSLGQRDCPALKERCDSIIRDIVAAQDSTGYLHTQYMLEPGHPASPQQDQKNVKTFGYGPSNRWKSLKSNWPFAYSQLYCAGHMMEAGIAYYKGTGEKALLDAAVRFADLICKVFDKKKIMTYADHPEVEIGLMALYSITGNRTYLNTADTMCRHINFSRPVDIHRDKNSLPLARQHSAFGHCVRTAYLYTGATEVARATGSRDLHKAMDRLWKSVTDGKMYIHGGTGNGTEAEQHGEKNDLPIGPVYSECCASIACAQWGHSMNLLEGLAKYASLVELEMYNCALSGISLDGRRFFYSNKINIGPENRRNKHSGVRQTYLFCCPSKLPVFISGIGRWIYSKDNKGIYVNQYVGSKVTTGIGGRTVSLSMESDYIYGGKCSIDVMTDGKFTINLRVPQWLKKEHIEGSPYYYGTDRHCHGSGVTVEINGKAADIIENKDGYIQLERDWNAGDRIDIRFSMDIKRVHTRNEVRANRGRIALMRGPLLYCLEGVDNGDDVRRTVLPDSSSIVACPGKILSEQTVMLKGDCLREGKPEKFVAVPYFLWENRGISSMVLLPVSDEGEAVDDNTGIIEEYNTNG